MKEKINLVDEIETEAFVGPSDSGVLSIPIEAIEAAKNTQKELTPLAKKLLAEAKLRHSR